MCLDYYEKSLEISVLEVINSSATSMCSINKDNFTFHCLHAHIR